MWYKLALALASLVIVAGCGGGFGTGDTGGSDIAFVRDESPGMVSLWRMESGSIEQTGLLSWSSSPARVAFSPDGGRVAMTLDHGGQYDIGVTGTGGGAVQWLTNDPSDDGDPAFSRDGSRIAFTSRRGGHSQIYVMNSDGTNETRLTNTSDLSDDDTSPAFSWDGTEIAFASNRNSSDPAVTHIYVMNADGGNVRQLTSGDQSRDTEPSFSPDGRQIVYVSAGSPGGPHDVYAVTADGTRTIALTEGWGDCHSPSFSPDGWTIVFASDRRNLYPQVWMMNTNGSGKGRITEFGGSFPAWIGG